MTIACMSNKSMTDLVLVPPTSPNTLPTERPSSEATRVCVCGRLSVCLSPLVAQVGRLCHFQSGHRTYGGGSMLTMIGEGARLKLRLRL